MALVCGPAMPSTVHAAGVVGTGTAASCTDPALDTALAGGGLVKFDCGPDPATIDISTGTGTKTVAIDTTIDGGGEITISGGNGTGSTPVGVFSVGAGVEFVVKNLAIAHGHANGGGISNDSGTVIVNDCTFTGNDSSSIRNGDGSLTITNSTFIGAGVGGGTSIGINNESGTVTVINSAFSGHFSEAGGGIFNDSGTLTVTNSAFTSNVAINTIGAGGRGAGGGGGIYSGGTSIVSDSTFTGNYGYSGGAIANRGALTVTNCTFSGNGPSGSSGEGGGISNDFVTATLTVTNSTFTSNSAGAISNNHAGSISNHSAVAALLRNTIVANGPSGDNSGTVNCFGNVTDGGHNLDDGTSCGFSTANGSLSNTDPQLDPAGLQHNGGPTQTVALCTGAGVPVGCTAASPAIDAGDPAVCAAALVNNRDQSGFVRPGAGHTHCSIGAFEADASAPGCSGDCEGSGRVSVDELIMGVNIALGSTTLEQCAAFDCNGTGRVTVDCLVQAVHNALDGCPAGVVSFAPGRCDVDLPAGQDPAHVECGYLTVPEDRGQAHGRTIRLAVAVLKATGAHPASDPIVMLSGGPGDGALDGIMQGWTTASAAPVQATRDLVFFDQRGTGRSQPALQCPEYTTSFSANLTQPLSAAEDAANLISALRACHDRLVSEGVNLAAYTSAATAADLHDLMTALGYAQWNVRGISYGTRAALTAMRDTPHGIRSVTLDSTVPVQANHSANFSADFERALNTLFAGCASDPGCNAAYPALEDTFFSLVAQLNASPVTVQPKDPVSGMPFDVVVTGDRLLLGIHSALHSTDLIPLLPLIITATASGNTALLAVASITAPGELAQGVSQSVSCGEEVPFNTPEIIAAATAHVRAEIRNVGLAAITNFELEVCAFWGAGQPLPFEHEPVTSAIPTLVLAGEYDPITPPADGQLAAQTLSHSFYFLFPGQGHGELYTPGDPGCGVQLFAAFLDDPTQPPDASCVAALPAPHFAGS